MIYIIEWNFEVLVLSLNGFPCLASIIILFVHLQNKGVQVKSEESKYSSSSYKEIRHQNHPLSCVHCSSWGTRALRVYCTAVWMVLDDWFKRRRWAFISLVKNLIEWYLISCLLWVFHRHSFIGLDIITVDLGSIAVQHEVIDSQMYCHMAECDRLDA